MFLEFPQSNRDPRELSSDFGSKMNSELISSLRAVVCVVGVLWGDWSLSFRMRNAFRLATVHSSRVSSDCFRAIVSVRCMAGVV